MSRVRFHTADAGWLQSMGRRYGGFRKQQKKQDSLFCKVAYMIDLQQEKLVMFVGRQMQPQEKKPYGAAGERYSGIKEAYYACRLCVMFSFRYIRTFSSEEISGDMERTVESRERRS